MITLTKSQQAYMDDYRKRKAREKLKRRDEKGLSNISAQELKRNYVKELKSDPCVDCGIRYPHFVMDFDHIPELGKKNFNIGAGDTKSWRQLKNELKKCEIVCSNCHRVRTYLRRTDA